MADLFRSAFSYISGSVSGGSIGSERGSEMIGEMVELGELKLKVKKVIAEGEKAMFWFHGPHSHTRYHSLIGDTLKGTVYCVVTCIKDLIHVHAHRIVLFSV